MWISGPIEGLENIFLLLQYASSTDKRVYGANNLIWGIKQDVVDGGTPLLFNVDVLLFFCPTSLVRRRTPTSLLLHVPILQPHVHISALLVVYQIATNSHQFLCRASTSALLTQIKSVTIDREVDSFNEWSFFGRQTFVIQCGFLVSNHDIHIY